MGDINSDNISRPRDGSFKINHDMPFSEHSKSKMEIFDHINKEIDTASSSDSLLHNSSINAFVNAISGKNTTLNELSEASKITKNLINNINLLSEESQENLVSIPKKIASHRNANYNTALEGQELYKEMSSKITKFTSGEAQRSFINGIDGMNNSRTKDQWHVSIFDNIAQNTDEGIDSINDVARNDLIKFIGNTAQNLLSVSSDDQIKFQKDAISMLQKTQFPYKFDANALKEALFVVPEITQTNEFKKALKDLEEELSVDVAE